MATEKEPPVGLTEEKMKELTELATRTHPFLAAPLLLVHFNDLIRILRHPEKPTSNSGK